MAIEIRNLTKYYKNKGKSFAAIENLSIDIGMGEVTSLIGPNGAGKTTLIKMICGLVTKDKGTIHINGESVDQNKYLPSRQIGVVLEGARNLYNFLTVDGNIRYFSHLNHLGKDEVSKKSDLYLNMFQLADKRTEPVNNLSRGMQQKVAIILALLKDPPILILDEPTLGLDIESSISICRLLAKMCSEEKKTVIFTSHKLDFVQKMSDRIAILRKGRMIACDSSSNLIDVLNVPEEYQVLIIKDDKTKWKEYYSSLEKGAGKILKDDENSFEVQLGNYYEFTNTWVSDLKVHKMERISHTLDKAFLSIIEGGVE